MVANLKKHLARIREKTKRGNYWQRRKDSIYLFAARQICELEYGEPISVLDVGSNATPTLEWHRAAAKRLVSVDLRRPYVAEGVESLTCDFLQYEPESRFDMVTCFQVLEHVPDAASFARKLLRVADVAVVSVPYKWKRGSCKWHVHDPVDERKMRSWFGREPDFSYIACELNNVKRLINVYRT
ncbi:MAG TPA: methyltransferase domain-containing protein [Pseudomonadales bacterium]